MVPTTLGWVGAAVAAGCLVAIVAVALLIGGRPENPQATPSLDVEVPRSPEGSSQDDGSPTDGPRAPPDPVVLCQPPSCERWRVDLPTGSTVVDDGTVYHVGRTEWRVEMTAIDGDTGMIRWRTPLVIPDAVNGDPLRGGPPWIVTDRDDVIVVAVDGLLEARHRTDGTPAWTLDREGWVPYGVNAGPSGSILVSAGVRAPDATIDNGWSGEVLAALDGMTGAVLWEREVGMTLWAPLSDVGAPNGPPLVLISAPPTVDPDEDQSPVDEVLVALDPVTGEELWRRPLPHGGFGLSGSTLQVEDDSGWHHWDARTGEALDAPLPDGAVDDVGIEVVGGLLVARWHLREPDSSTGAANLTQRIAVFDRDDGGERFTASAPEWVGLQTLPDGGMVVVSGDDQTLTLSRLASDGDLRWERDLGVPVRRSWPRSVGLLDDGTIVLLAADGPGTQDVTARRLDPETGEDVASFHLDVAAGEFEPYDLELRWPLVVDHRSSGSGMRLHGPAGSIELTQDVSLPSAEPLVVTTSTGTVVRLDEGLLVGGR